MSGVVAPKEREIVVTRVFDAPRRLVFETWTKPEHLAHWWGLRGFTLPVCVAFRPGGAYRHCMRLPEGRDYWSRASIVKSSRRSGSSSPLH